MHFARERSHQLLTTSFRFKHQSSLQKSRCLNFYSAQILRAPLSPKLRLNVYQPLAPYSRTGFIFTSRQGRSLTTIFSWVCSFLYLLSPNPETERSFYFACTLNSQIMTPNKLIKSADRKSFDANLTQIRTY